MSAQAIQEVVAKGPAQEKPFKLFKRSPIIYWWPIWVTAFVMALLSYLDGGYMVWVPPGTEARRDWSVETEPGRTQPREGLLLPPAGPTFCPPCRPTQVNPWASPSSPACVWRGAGIWALPSFS
jgi:hypothetical protein